MSVTSADVRRMIPSDVLSDSESIDWALEDAQALMSAPFAAASTPVTQAVQDLVIKYLAAHFVTLKVERGGLVSSKTGEASDTYVQPRDKSGLFLSRYGQMAASLDPTSFLKGLSTSKGVAQIKTLGPYCERYAYW